MLYGHKQLREWYANGPLGLEQGFTVLAPTVGHAVGPMTLALGLAGNAHADVFHGGSGVTFSHGSDSLVYRGLVVTDTRGMALRSRLQLHGAELLLQIESRGARFPLRVDPFIQQAKLAASDGAAWDELGTSVAIDGDTIVAGAPSPVVDTTSPGAAYVFVKPKGGWQDATETAKLTDSDGAAGEALGISVAIDGDTIVAGVPGASGTGAVYVFVKPKGGWRSETETAKLTGSVGTLSLGFAVAVRGDTVAASAPFMPQAAVNGDRGVVYVFSKPKGGWRSETGTARLTASDEAMNGELGASGVGISGHTIVAGGGGGVPVGQPTGVYVFVEPKGGGAARPRQRS